jgi:hypothetical protein
MMRPLLSMFALAVLATACGGYGNRLEGSISQSFSLDFNKDDIRKQDASLIVEYTKTSGATVDKVAKMVFDTSNLNGLGKNSKVNGQLFKDRVVVQREAATGGDFPAIESGELDFGDFQFKDGGHMSGSFNVGFQNGFTLYGEFNGTCHVVNTQ